MISNKIREARKGRSLKMTKNLERLYKDGKCTECSVVVTRMDFAKILGKFTKVKIQYESSSTPKSKRNNQQLTSPNTRLKSNENGMVLIRRKAYNQHPVKEIIATKLTKVNESASPRNKGALKENRLSETSTPRQRNNILKENNRIKKIGNDEKNSNYYLKNVNSNLKSYGIVFMMPENKNNNERNKLLLKDLLPSINKDILPTEEWGIDYLPNNGEPKEDKVYDRIAAELEGLMNNEKSPIHNQLKESPVIKDEYPSILDILNENTSENNQRNSQSGNIEFKSNMESSDVEAILLGKSNETQKEPDIKPMEVDNPDVTTLIDVQMNTNQGAGPMLDTSLDESIDNPHSPSILDEALQKGIEEHLPMIQMDKTDITETDSSESNNNMKTSVKVDIKDQSTAGTMDKENNETSELNLNSVTHVLFKKIVDGVCQKAVTCPKNLKYTVELRGKSIEFLGAPKFISNLEDLRVLLQIVNESELDSLYVLH